MSFERICIVPARGGSKGLSGKNLKVFAGETLVGLALRKAIESDAFDQVVLTSDDATILLEGKKVGAICHQRSEVTSSDNATSEDALLEVLDDIGVNVGTIAMIQCTTPLITIKDIAACMLLARRETLCTVVSGYVGSLHHWIIHSNNTLDPVGDSKHIRKPRQGKQDRIFVENGGIYVTDIAAFRQSVNRFNGQVIPYIMEENRSIDIDTEADFQRLLISMPVSNENAASRSDAF